MRAGFFGGPGAARLMLLAWLLAGHGCAGYLWEPLRCFSVAWTARGQVCRGAFSARTCARSQAEADNYVASLEAELLGDMQSCIAELQDRIPLCEYDEAQLATVEVLSNLCCGRGSTCNSDADCEPLEAQSGYVPALSTVLELGGAAADFISVKQVDISAKSFSFAFWARRRKIATRMMVLWGNSPHTNLHVGFRESDAFVFSFTQDGWDSPNGLQTSAVYPNDQGVWVHWAGTYDIGTGARIIYRNGGAVASDVIANGYQRSAEDLHISSGSTTHNAGPFHGTLDDIYVLARVLAPTEVSVLVREKQISRQESLLLWFNFEDPAKTNPVTGAAGDNVTDLSLQKNHGVLHGNWNRTKMHPRHDSVPISVTCTTSLHGTSPENCHEALDFWERGVCVDSSGMDIAANDEVKLAELSLPADYTYPPSDRDAQLVLLKDYCAQMCKDSSMVATACKSFPRIPCFSCSCAGLCPVSCTPVSGSVSCECQGGIADRVAFGAGELKVTDSSAACYGHTHEDVDRPSGVFVYGGQQYCWTAKSILAGRTLPAGDGKLRGPGGWTDGLSRLSPSCFPRYFDDRTFQCLFRSICGAAYDALQP